MGRKLLTSIAAIVGIVVVGFLILTLSLDGVVKSRIQQSGTDILGTEVDVDDVALSLFDGEGTIEGLAIYNPEKFEDRPAIQFKQIELKVDLSTLLSDTIVVTDLTVQNPSVYVEQNPDGNNLKTLQDRLGSSSGESYQSHLVIDHLLIKEGNVLVRAKIGEERNVQATISEVELRDVGREGSNTIAETTRQILDPVLERAITEAAKEGLKDVIQDQVQDLLGN